MGKAKAPIKPQVLLLDDGIQALLASLSFLVSFNATLRDRDDPPPLTIMWQQLFSVHLPGDHERISFKLGGHQNTISKSASELFSVL